MKKSLLAALVLLFGTSMYANTDRDCTTGYPYLETFDVNEMNCWGNFDEDGDGFSWELAEGYSGYGVKSVSWSYVGGSLDPDNWLISPEIEIPATAASEGYLALSWFVKGDGSLQYPEHYGVYISTTGGEPADFTNKVYEGLTPSSTWTQFSVNLSTTYVGQTVRIAFRHYESYGNWDFTIDNIEIKDETEPGPVTCDPITEFPYFNDFENFLDEKDCWMSIDFDGDGHDWLTATEQYWNQNPGFGVDGSHCIVSQSYENYIGAYNADNYILSPEFVLPVTNDAIMLSWSAQSQDYEYPDYYEVMIAPYGTTEISGFVKLFGEIGANPYVENTVDISEYAGTTVRIVFHHQDYDNYMINIDNMKIEISGVGVEENNSEVLAVYPNPVKNVMNLKGVAEGTEVRIYDVTGSEVMSFVYKGQNVNVEDLSNGVYVLRAGDSTIKIVK